MIKIGAGVFFFALYIFLGIFYVQFSDGVSLYIYGWPTELKSPAATIIQMLVVSTISLAYLYAGNYILIGLNQLILGGCGGLAALLYTYIFGRGDDVIFNIYLVLSNYPQNIVMVIMVVYPIVVGWALNNHINVRNPAACWTFAAAQLGPLCKR